MEENVLPSPEQVEEALKAEPEELDLFTSDEEKTIARKLIPLITKKAIETAEARKAKELEKVVAELTTSNEKMITAELDKLRKANEPLSSEELQKLVSQEYIEFQVSVNVRGHKNGNGIVHTEKRDFVICEVSARVEQKFLKAIKKTLADNIKEIAAIDWSGMGGIERLQRVIDVVPTALDTLASCVALCLDPHGEDKEIDGDWVLEHLQISQMIGVLQLQAEANRWRDFFSLASRFIPRSMIA